MFSPSAIADFLACQHLTALNRAAKAGEIKKPYFADPGLELLQKLGLAHEQRYLKQLEEDQQLNVFSVPDGLGWSDAAARTIEAMRAGAEAIYQPSFLSPQWYGRADFLLRVDKPSKLGSWSYEVVETKLARSTKARAVIQLCFYSDLLADIQGVLPAHMHVVLGGNTQPEHFSVRRYLAYFRKVKREFVNAYQAAQPTYPEPVDHCRICDWSTVCDERWHTDDHLSLVASITRNQRKALVEHGVNTLAELGRLTLPVIPKIERISDHALENIRDQAQVQLQGREEQRRVHRLLPPEPEKGLLSLPAPSAGDVFLDFEGDRFAFVEGLEYLSGVLTLSDDGPVYTPSWALDQNEEKLAFESFIGTVMERRRQYPNMHVYHYGAYETTAIKRMAGQHATCIDEVDELLRAGVFVDLYRAVKQGLRASVESYSIKKLEPFYNFKRAVQLLDANLALQTFQSVLVFGSDEENLDEIRECIAGYNRDDCLSAWRLRDWLEQLRLELEAQSQEFLPRPAPKEGQPQEDLSQYLERVRALEQRLTDSLPEDKETWTPAQRAIGLLADLLEWHRREDKSMWWEYYRLCELTNDELIEDKNALGGLVYVDIVNETPRSFIHRYRFPLQDHAIDRALAVHDPRTQDSAGTVVGIDELDLTIDLKREKKSEKPHPTALIPYNYIPSDAQVESLLRFGTWVAENGIEDESRPAAFQAACDILLRRTPRLSGKSIEALTSELSLLETAKTLALELDSSVLPIQGPPGSGKTFTGAEMIIELVGAGKRVGVTAGSHKVISNLLKALCEAAVKTKTDLSIAQKSNKSDGCEHELVKQIDDNAKVLERLQRGECKVAAGTSWLWAREEFAGSVDVLFVDEAGQMSLADVLAMSPAAKSLVLLGDPQQLDQPQQGVHPPGAEVSALAYLLNGRATIESHQGLFLSESWRLHADICRFTSEVFYDGKFQPRSENARQRLCAAGPLDGTGLRFVPVDHIGNQSDSPEEVERVTELIKALLRDGTTWTNKEGETRAIELKDILIVAPYNAQVALLARSLPAGARVGTVDKFQGQEAPVVFYSMTTSTPEDAPRGMEFLYSSNRLNVATSRAQCVTVLVASPALFDVQCRTPRQMELANAFCRYLELSEDVVRR